jgi:hypothetical protein
MHYQMWYSSVTRSCDEIAAVENSERAKRRHSSTSSHSPIRRLTQQELPACGCRPSHVAAYRQMEDCISRSLVDHRRSCRACVIVGSGSPALRMRAVTLSDELRMIREHIAHLL